MKHLIYLILLFIIFFNSCIEENLNSSGKSNHDLTAKVIYLKDGDSFVVIDGKEEVEVRMIDIDAPELYQAHGKKAKQFLSKLIKGKKVGLDYDHKDKYGRILARAYLDTMDLNYVMVAAGYAWQYRHSEDQDLSDAEAGAQEARKGLWQDKNPEAPWEWRKGHSRR